MTAEVYFVKYVYDACEGTDDIDGVEEENQEYLSVDDEDDEVCVIGSHKSTVKNIYVNIGGLNGTGGNQGCARTEAAMKIKCKQCGMSFDGYREKTEHVKEAHGEESDDCQVVYQDTNNNAKDKEKIPRVLDSIDKIMSVRQRLQHSSTKKKGTTVTMIPASQTRSNKIPISSKPRAANPRPIPSKSGANIRPMLLQAGTSKRTVSSTKNPLKRIAVDPTLQITRSSKVPKLNEGIKIQNVVSLSGLNSQQRKNALNNNPKIMPTKTKVENEQAESDKVVVSKAARNEARSKRRIARAQRTAAIDEETNEPVMELHKCIHCPGFNAVSGEELQAHFKQFHIGLDVHEESGAVNESEDNLECHICPGFKAGTFKELRRHMVR